MYTVCFRSIVALYCVFAVCQFMRIIFSENRVKVAYSGPTLCFRWSVYVSGGEVPQPPLMRGYKKLTPQIRWVTLKCVFQT